MGVGGLVVGVVVGALAGGVLVGAEVGRELDPPAGGVVVVVGVEVVVVEGWADVPGAVVVVTVGEAVFNPVDPPGCSLATATPMKAVVPPAITMMARVSRLIRACARALAFGEYRPRPRLTVTI